MTAAFELVAGDDGVDGLSMPRLARHLRVGVTSLYWYFRSKDELMSALTEEAADRLYQMLPDYRERPWDEHLHRYGGLRQLRPRPQNRPRHVGAVQVEPVEVIID